MDKFKSYFVNKLISISLFTLIICLIFVVSKYIGLDILILKILKSFIPVFIAIIVSFILEPLICLIMKKGIKRKTAVFMAYGLIIIILGLLLCFLVPSLFGQIEIFSNNIPSLLQVLEKFLNNVGLDISLVQIKYFLTNMIAGISPKILAYLSSSLSMIIDVLLGISGAFFLSFDFDKFKKWIKNHLPKKIRKPLIYYLENYLPFIHKYVLGMLVDSLIVLIICLIGFSVIGVEYVLVISVLIAITNLIPIIGPYIGGVPAALIGFSVSPTLGVSTIIVVVVVQIIESNFIQPMILKNVISLHPLEGILGISLFGTLFGIVGMILSPILILGIKLLFIPYEEKEINYIE